MKILVIPDTHGRTFWKEILKTHPIENFDKVVFLGDYLDPYDFEHINVEEAMGNFAEILNFKDKYQDKVVLLLGNHDLPYYFKFRGVSRWSSKHHVEIETLFDEDRNFFQLAFETDHTLFTHSGFLQSWADWIHQHVTKEETDDMIEIFSTEASLNGLLHSDDAIRCLEMVSHSRGGRFPNGSCVWADVEEHQWNRKYKGKYQVFGHTLQLDLYDYYMQNDENLIKDGDPIINNHFAMLDCRHGFIYDEENREFWLVDNDGKETLIPMYQEEECDDETE